MTIDIDIHDLELTVQEKTGNHLAKCVGITIDEDGILAVFEIAKLYIRFEVLGELTENQNPYRYAVRLYDKINYKTKNQKFNYKN